MRFRWFVCNAAGSGEITDHMMPSLQKSKNTKSGTEMQRDKDSVAEIMKKKQQAGKLSTRTFPRPIHMPLPIRLVLDISG